MNRIFVEALVVGVVGALLAFAANGLSPAGLRLNRDYFPKLSKPSKSGQGTNQAVASVQGADTNDPHIRKLIENGMQVVTTEEASLAFRDDRFRKGSFVFVDARDVQFYEQGHIPNAVQFFHYRPEAFLPTLLPRVQGAEKIIVYCNGGDCEDSQFTAVFLRDSIGIAPEKIFVYAGGIQAWAKAGLPLQTGSLDQGVDQPLQQ